MTTQLTVRDLMLPGEPIDGAQALTGEVSLDNPVTWVVSLRPFSPAFPRLRGGEIALVATENLARHDPPISLRDVVQLLSSHAAAAIAVRGEVDNAAIQVARQAQMPLLVLPAEPPLADIEQAIMRECAFHQARSEMTRPEEPDTWLEDLLSGRDNLLEGAILRAERQGYVPSKKYAVAVAAPMPRSGMEAAQSATALRALGEALQAANHARGDRPSAVRHDRGLAILLPKGSEKELLTAVEGAGSMACGIGSVRPLLQATTSLEEAQLALSASVLIYDGKPIYFSNLGPLRLLLLLHRDQPGELSRFVNETIGPLLEHDRGSASPLLPTVRAFVERGGRLRETAEHIFVHRNTLAYRLQRAAEILGTDLKDAEVRLGVELALKALPLVESGTV